MGREKRQKPRRAVEVTGFLYTVDGWPLGQCRMLDVSESGAKLSHTIEDELPDEILLSFSRNGKVRRHCQVVRRQDDEIGIQFVRDLGDGR